MTVHRELAVSSTAAFAFPDLLQFGIEALCYLPPSEIPRIADRLRHQGLVRKRAKAKQATLHAALKVPATLQSGKSFDVGLEPFIEPVDSEHIRITNRSSVTLNGLRLLRLMHGMEGWPVGLDGQDNVAGPTTGHGPDRVDELLLAIGELVEQAIDAIRFVLPDQLAVEEEYMRLRKAELTRDLCCPDPVGATMAVGQSSFRGAIAATSDVYRQTVTSAEGVPVVRFRLKKAGVDLKVYGKTGGLLRHEVSCLGRDSVVALTGRERDEIGGHTAVTLVRSFIDGATPLLVDFAQHVNEVRTELVSPAMLLVELAPLVELVVSNSSWSADAAVAWNALMVASVFDAKAKRKGTVLRDVLEALATPTGPLLHGARPTLYHLHPRLAQRASR